MSERPTAAQMNSPLWRIRNIYSFKDRKGRTRRFKPTKEQEEILRQIYILKRKKIFILKARQLGMSTLIAIVSLDSILFGKGVQVSIADFVSGNAKKKLEQMILYAFSKLPKEWKVGWEVVTHNKQQGEFRIKIAGGDKEDERVIYAGDSIRGGTNQLIHLSELGETQIKAPERAREIIEGALPSAESSTIIIETTWHGGKIGKLYKIVQDALETPDEDKDLEKDFFVAFFPWNEEKTYISKGNVSQLTSETNAYFDSLQLKHGTRYSNEQRLWYQKKKKMFGERIYSIYPTVLEEIFLSPIEGAILAKEVDEARASGRITNVPWDPTKKVHTIWDIGAPINTIVHYFQKTKDGFAFIDSDVLQDESTKEIHGLDLNYPERVAHMNAKPYEYGTHFLPHDGGSRDLRDRTTTQQDFIRHGLKGTITVVPRTNDKWLSINQLKLMFGSFTFDAVKCGPMIDGIATYRLRQDPKDETKFTNEIVHDWASHIADAARTLAEAYLKGFITEEGNEASMNTMLDRDKLQEAFGKMLTDKPRVGRIDDHAGKIKFIADESGWINKWEDPRLEREYIMIVHKSSVQVWRAPYFKEPGDQKKAPAKLVASTVRQKRVDDDILTEWAAKMSRIYGDCITVVTINDRDRIVQKMNEADIPLYRREVLESKKPVGRSRPPKKPGFDLSDTIRTDAMEELIGSFRDEKIEFYDSILLAQCDTFIINEDGSYSPQQGHEGDLVESAAIACLTMPLATVYSADTKDLVKFY